MSKNTAKISEHVDARHNAPPVEHANAASEGAQVVHPGPGNVIELPAGTALASLEADGRDLVIVLDDGEKLIVPDGAVLVPEIVVGNTVVPPANIAALLIDSEPQPAAGPPSSSGGNFATDEGAIQAAYGLGNLLPYTELQFAPQPTQEILPGLVNHEPGIVIETPDSPAGSIEAIATVYEAGLPARNGEPAGTGEAADGNPNNDSDGRETTAGTIVFNSPDGTQAVLINGVAIDHIGQTFSSPFGTMTITSIDLAGGRIGFSYTLADNMVGQTADGFFQMTVVDSDGDQATASLQINVVDDAPIAADDTDVVAAGTYGPESGNVISGAGTTSGSAGADRVGADNASVSSVSHGSTNVSVGASGSVIAGDYGSLTLHADGSYTYVRNAGTPGGVSDSFTYTLTDGDGSTDTAILTINIGDSSATVISVPETGDGTIVDEHGLPPHGGEPVGSGEGSDGDPDNNSDTSEATSGTITFSAPDGPATVEINGSVITGPGQVITVPEGTLTITGFDPNAGTIDYTFTLSTNTSGDDTSVTFAVTVTDVDGDSDTAPFTIHIIDDVPVANADVNSVSEGSSTAGAVLPNDVAGADGLVSGGVTGVATGSDTSSAVTGNVGSDLAGAYGTLHLNADGSYTYTANPDAVTADAVDHFVYTITDGDGDTSTTTLDITVNDVTLAGDDQTQTVYEAALDLTQDGSDLAAGTVTGSDPTSTGETVSGALAVAGATSYTLNGSSTGSYGEIHLNADGTYTYTLTTPVDDLPHANDGNDTQHPGEVFTYTATDANGNTVNGTITIDIVDDVPTAHDDSASVGEGSSIGGNVLTNDVAGADGFAAAPTGAVTGIASVNQGTSDTSQDGSGNYALAGQYGTLTLNRDGTYSYQSNGNSVTGTQHDVFHYTVVDSDGDTSTATLDITINNVTLVADNQLKTVYEAALDTTTTGSDITHGTVTGSNPSLTTETTTGTLAVTGATSYTLVGSSTGTYGQIQLNSNGTYTYTLTTPVDDLPHANDGNDTQHPGEVFTYTATDANGNTVNGTITIDIVDDVPTAHDDSASVGEGSSIGGNVLTNDVAGADGFAAAPTGAVTGIASVNQGTSDTSQDGSGNYALAGQYGTLTLNRDGTYSYQSNGNSVTGTQHDVFHYTVVDSDGDTSTATLDITINNVTLVADNQLKTVYEAALDTTTTGSDITHGTVTGSNPSLTTETTTGTLAVTGATSYTLVGSSTGTYGQIQLNSNGTYTYTLTTPVDDLPHANDGNDTQHPGEVFTYTATDANGNTVNGTITIDIVDDVPTAHDDSASVGEGSSIGGNVLTNDVAGADGFAAAPTGAVTGIASVNQGTSDTSQDGSGNYALAGQYGTLTLNRDGTYSYQSNGNSVTGTQHDVFHYTVVDSDGDTSTATLDITINNVTLVADNQLKTVYEAALDTTTTGSDITHGTVTGSNPSLTTETTTGTLAVTGATSYTLVGSSTGTYGQIQLNSNGTYTYTLTTPVDDLPHANDGNDTQHPGETFTYTATDANGNTVNGTITIDIVDDVPTAHDDSASVGEGSSIGGNVLTNDVAGADGFAAAPTGAVTGIASVNQGTSDTSQDGSGNYALAGQYGTLTLNRDGTYSYQSNGNSVTGTQHDVFHYTVVDSDGDTSTATLDITINNVTLVADNQLKTVYEAALDTTTTGSDITHGTVTGSNPSLTTETTTGTLAVTGATSYTLVGSSTGTYGQIQLNSNGTYTYTLTTPVDDLPHANDGNDTQHPGETFTYTATDANGNTVNGTITIDIVDDVPTAHDDSASVGEGSSIGGNVLTNDVAGADGFAAAPTGAVTGIASVNQGTSDTSQDGSGNYALAGQYGTLTLNRDGTYSYQSNGNSVTGTQHDVFHYTVVDSDGDTSTATLDITINNVTLVADNQLKTVYEAALDTTTTGSDITHGTVTGSNPSLTTETTTGTLAVTGATSYTLVGSSTGTYGQIQLNSNGTYTYTLTTPVDDLPHANDGNDTQHPGEVFTYTATDANGNTVNGTITIDIVDDVPVISSVTSPLNITNSGTVSATGNFVFTVGADQNTSTHNDITNVTLSATVAGNAASNVTISETSENATTAVYSFSFDYDTGTGGTDHETGTLTFDKVAGTYTVDLDHPVQSFSLLDTAGAPASAFVNYNSDGTVSSGPSNIATVQLSPSIFMQFTGVADKTGSDHLTTTQGADTTFTPNTTSTFANLELFSQASATVTVSSTAAGVAGNTIGGGEVLDFNLYATDPHGTTGGVPTAQATSMFIKLDGVGSSEDMIVVLKLYDTSTHQYSTLALMVQNGDIIKTDATLTGTAYDGITLDNNDGIVIIEANDYQNGNTNLVIVGAQIAGSDDGITGTAEDFNGALGNSGGWLGGTQAFSTDVSDSPFKVSDIGFVTQVSTAQAAQLNFDVTVTDSDGDTASQSLTVNIGGTPPVVLDLDGDGLEFLGLDAGVTHDYGAGLVATAWVAPDDGLLAHDTGDGFDIVFADDAPGAKTDLQGLALAYDSNHDGQLTSADDAWGSFGVWQDGNSNGVVDADEFKTLDEMGISSIGLTTNGKAYSAADGDVTVLGTGSFARGDGSTGTLGDTVFATAAQKIGQQTGEYAVAAAALGGFLAVPLVLADSSTGLPQPVAAKLADVLPTDVQSATVNVEHEHTAVSAASLELAAHTTGWQPPALPSSSGTHQTVSSDDAKLPELPRLGISTQQLPEQASSISEGASTHGAHGPSDVGLMNALLSMHLPGGHGHAAQTSAVEQRAEGVVTTQDMPKVAALVHDALAGHVIDQLVDKFANGQPQGAGAQSDTSHAGHDASSSHLPATFLNAQSEAHSANSANASAIFSSMLEGHTGHEMAFAMLASMPTVEEHMVTASA